MSEQLKPFVCNGCKHYYQPKKDWAACKQCLRNPNLKDLYLPLQNGSD